MKNVKGIIIAAAVRSQYIMHAHDTKMCLGESTAWNLMMSFQHVNEGIKKSKSKNKGFISSS